MWQGETVAKSCESKGRFVPERPVKTIDPNILDPTIGTIEIEAAEGTEFGFVEERPGKIVLVVKPPGQPWPHGRPAPKRTSGPMPAGNQRYCFDLKPRP